MTKQMWTQYRTKVWAGYFTQESLFKGTVSREKCGVSCINNSHWYRLNFYDPPAKSYLRFVFLTLLHLQPFRKPKPTEKIQFERTLLNTIMIFIHDTVSVRLQVLLK